MPEINHKDLAVKPPISPSVQASQPQVQPTSQASKPPVQPVSTSTKAERVVASVPQVSSEVQERIDAATVVAGVPVDVLADKVREVLDQRKVEAVEALRPKEPDYSKLNEADIYAPDVYIPVIEHELADYMNMKLQDENYLAVWANKDQRRLGELLAQGYEFLKQEHVARSFTCPLKFNSEGLYEYQDVVCLRVHKRIKFAKLRRIQQASEHQLKPTVAQENAKAQLMEKLILGDPALDAAFASGSTRFYTPSQK